MRSELVITGFGAVGAFGGSCDALCAAVASGKPFAAPSVRLGDSYLSAEMTDFDLRRYRHTANGHRAPRISQYAMAAAAQAIDEARLEDRRCNRDEVAVVFGTGNGPAEVVARNLRAITADGLGAVEPLAFQESVFNAPGSRISIEYGFRGPLLALPMGWAAGGHAVAAAAELIEAGHAEAALVVAADEITPLTHGAVAALGLARGAEAVASRGDRPRISVYPSEGAAAVVLETRAHAVRRDARPMLELAGWGVRSDVFGVGAKGRGPASLSKAMQSALARVSRSPMSLVTQVYAGSYGSADADQAEADALVEVFGKAACPPLLNLRPIIGETKAAAALFNLIVAAAAIGGQQRLGDQPRGDRSETHDAVLCNAFWVNGTNTSLLVRRPG